MAATWPASPAGSPLTQAMPDMYIDVQNAASMLFRLARQGIDVGDRWTELADKAAVAAHVTLTSTPAVEGAWAWIKHDDGRWGYDDRR